MADPRCLPDARRSRAHLTLCALLPALALLTGLVVLPRGARDATVAPEASLGGAEDGLPPRAAPVGGSGPAAPASARLDERAPGDAADLGSLPFDLGAIIDQVHFAYRESDAPGRYAGAHSTYAVEIDPAVATLRAYHSPAEPEGVRESAPLRLSLERLGRGERAVRSGEARVEDDGHLAIARGEAVEHYRNRAEGVEQSWSFERKPSGDGDLVVRVAASGLDYRGTTESGLHFADASGLGFRYGHGTWIDATGREAHVEARWADGAIELVVPSGVIEGAAYPAVLDPMISPEIDLDEPVTSPAAGGQTRPSVASDGSGYLVVWDDIRRARSDVYGALVSSDGTVLSSTGLVVASSAGQQRFPRVASHGSGYLVVWEDTRNDGIDVYGTLVSSDGIVPSPEGIAVSVADGDQRVPAVASDGSGYLVVWMDSRDGETDLYATAVANDGTVQTPEGVAVSVRESEQIAPSVASNGSGYLVVWSDHAASSSDVYGALVASDGTVQSPGELAVSTAEGYQTDASVASDGSGYLVVWHGPSIGPGAALYGTVVAGDGTVQSPDGLSLSPAEESRGSATLASNGSGYLVVWTSGWGDEAEIHGVLVASDGTLEGSGELTISAAANEQRAPRVASNGSDYLVVWQDDRIERWRTHIFGTRVGDEGTVMSPDGFMVSTAANAQDRPRVASNESGYLAVWTDFRTGSSDIFGALLAPDGTPETPSGLVISTAVGAQSAADVASNGNGYLVVWSDARSGSSEIYETAVASDGAVVSPSGVAITTGATEGSAASVASDGGGYLVVWSERRSDSADLYGALIASDGTVSSSSGFAVSTSPGDQHGPDVASDGSGYLVVWQDSRGASGDLYGTLIASDGTVQSPSGIPIASEAHEERLPSVGSNGSGYLVVWQDDRNDSADLYGALVASDGTVQSPSALPVSTAPGGQYVPSVASNGSRYLVVWEDLRSEATNDVYGTWVTSGVVEPASGIVLAADETMHERLPSVSGGPDGAFLLAYGRFIPGPPYEAPRVRGRLIRHPDDPGAPCDGAACPGGGDGGVGAGDGGAADGGAIAPGAGSEGCACVAAGARSSGSPWRGVGRAEARGAWPAGRGPRPRVSCAPVRESMSARERAFVYAVSLVLLGATLSPLARHPDDDSFPLSTYPMFSRERPREIVMVHAVGVDAAGERTPLRPMISAGNREVLQSMATLQQAVGGGRARQHCQQIAARVRADASLAGVREVEIATDTFDSVAYFAEGRTEPLARAVHARCAVEAR